MIEDDGDRERRIRENLHAHNANNGLNITPPSNSSMATCNGRQKPSKIASLAREARR